MEEKQKDLATAKEIRFWCLLLAGLLALSNPAIASVVKGLIK